MKFIIILILPLLLITSSISYALIDKQWDTPLNFVDGSSSSLRELTKTAPVYLKFWASWCKDCLEQMSHFQDVHDQYGEDIHVIGVNVWKNEDMNDIQKVIKKYKLEIRIALDKESQMTQAFNLIGTPYHLLIDQQGNVLHSGYTADSNIDQKIALLATGKLKNNPIDIVEAAETELDKEIAKLIKSSKPTGILFTATWCDSYLVDHRPKNAARCQKAQKLFNQLSEKYKNIEWIVIATRLWTDAAELDRYQEKFDIEESIRIDEGNTVFTENHIDDFPTFIVYQSGKEILRESQFTSSDHIEQLIRTAY